MENLTQWQAFLALAPSIGGLLAIAAAIDSWRNRGDDTTLKRIGALKSSISELEEGYKRLESLKEQELELLKGRLTALEKKAAERDGWEARALAAEKLAGEAEERAKAAEAKNGQLEERITHLEGEVQRLIEEKGTANNGTAKL